MILDAARNVGIEGECPALGHFIDGNILEEGSERQGEVFNPATGHVAKRVGFAGSQVVEAAVSSAKQAFSAWRAVQPSKRARIMFRYKELLEANAERIATAITEEHGKTIADAYGEVQRGIEVVEFACGAPQLLKGEHAKDVGPSIDSWSEHQPLGVVAGVTPFNFPAMVPMWMFPMALICGNTFVLKPSEKAPSAPLILAQLLHEAGLPAGVLNVVNGDKEAVDQLIEHKDVQAISFVGSTPIAEYIYERASANGKRVQALGGAKNHAIIMPDADIENAANALMGAAFGSCGERCMAISVAVCVGDNVADGLVGLLKDRIERLKVGAGQDDGVEMGPLISRSHLDKVTAYVGSGVNEGAKLIVDGRKSFGDLGEGFFLGGCLFDQVKPNMKIYQEEIFGPVLCVVRVKTQDDAMELIDEHEYGNGACIFTRDGEAARYFTDNIRIGMVGVNVPLPVPTSIHSFGGWKRSLFGDLCAYGPDSIRFYTRRKTVTQRWPTGGVREAASFAFPSSGHAMETA
ncbi:MAG: CoA-acylating methylmalonate-semialdehyde dehydrogenase [Pseudomonadota bacterium]